MKLLLCVPLLLVSLSGRCLASGFFVDVDPAAWYARDVDTALREGWVEGYPGLSSDETRSFRPDDQITAGEAAKISALAAGLRFQPLICPSCHSASRYTSLIDGGPFLLRWENPGKLITREEAAAILATAFHLWDAHEIHNRDFAGNGQLSIDECTSIDDGNAPKFADINDSPYCAAIAYLKLWNVVHGVLGADGRPTELFHPNSTLSRAEFVRMAVNAWAAFSPESPYASRQIRLPADLHAPRRFAVFANGSVVFLNASEATMSLSFAPRLYATTSMKLEPGATRLFTKQVGTYQFTITSGARAWSGTLIIRPDPLPR